MIRSRWRSGTVLTLGILLAACSTDPTGSAEAADADADADATPTPDAGPTTCAPACGAGAPCAADGDCASGACSVDGACATGEADGKKDFGESDIDCGGANAPKCGVGKTCTSDADCGSSTCSVRNTCATSAADDGFQNEGESDIDCGGHTTDGAPKCATGKKCVLDNDCASGACNVDLRCAENGYSDGKKDFGETDVDCGGDQGAPKCADGKDCLAKPDCTSDVCNLSNKCAQPTASDGIKDGTETDIDCGGGSPTNAPRCAPAKTCDIDGDCVSPRGYTSGVCSDAKKCASAPSCRHGDGGYSCGPTKDQDCCASPAVGTKKIDAYKITAGRMREFLTKVNGDALGWYTSNRVAILAQNPRADAQLYSYLDATSGQRRGIVLPSDLHGYPWGVDYQLGGSIYVGNYPSGNQGCYVGPQNSNARGAHTYDNANAESDQRGYTREYLDRLPINCVTYVLLAAFCAWDGGRLSTKAERAAIGYTGTPTGSPKTSWIWGNTPVAGGWAFDTNLTIVGPATGNFLTATSACPTCDVQHTNWQQSYEHIRFDPNDNSNPAYYPPLQAGIPPRDVAVNYAYAGNDISYFISPPGRYPYDAYPAGTDLAVKTHYDVMGIMFEINEPDGAIATNVAGDADLYCVQNADCVTNVCNVGTHKCTGSVSQPRAAWTGGSWEGHDLTGTSSQPMMVKYGKATGRCARD